MTVRRSGSTGCPRGGISPASTALKRNVVMVSDLPEMPVLSRRTKAAFYSLAGPIMTVNGWVHRNLRARGATGQRVQLGPGQKNYLPGWLNIDANMFTARCDIWADLRNPLPLPDGSVAALYSHHVIEHLPAIEAHVRDAYRVLRPGGVYRIAGPNGDSAIRKFVERDAAWFDSYPDDRRSIGGRFENFIFCRQEHVTILTESFLGELLADAGFVEVHRCLPVRETRFPQLFSDCLAKEWESDFECPHTLVIEAVKPPA
jgi:predicted SAM-dependent methyltransferase